MRVTTTLITGTLIAGLIGALLTAAPATAQYFKKPESDLDASIMRIDEDDYLGAKLDAATPLIGADGQGFPLGDLLGKPLILVLAYYTCDGSCSVINSELANLLDEVRRVRARQDYQILTLSFDRHDDLKTTGAFVKQLELAGEHAAN